jgi:hypothetical protein
MRRDETRRDRGSGGRDGGASGDGDPLLEGRIGERRGERGVEETVEFGGGMARWDREGRKEGGPVRVWTFHLGRPCAVGCAVAARSVPSPSWYHYSMFGGDNFLGCLFFIRLLPYAV